MLPARDRHLTTFTVVALAVVFGDLVTKQLAIALFAGEGSSLGAFGAMLGDRVRLVLVTNSQAAFGIGLGPHTRAVNVALTLAAILFILPVFRDLAQLNVGAPRALGLIAGAAAGNLLSLVTSARGVPDFVAIDVGGNREIVLNFADVAAYVGLALMIPVGLEIVRRLRVARARARA